MSQATDGLDIEVINQAVDAIYAADGYVLPDGSRDRGKIQDKLMEMLAEHQVNTKADLDTKPITKGHAVGELFPSAIEPGTARFREADNQELAVKVWLKLCAHVWKELLDSYRGPVQQRISQHMGDGHILVRTTATADNVPAVYLTSTRTVIDGEYALKRAKELERVSNRVSRDLEMVSRRRPAEAKHWLGKFDKASRSALTVARERLVIAAADAANGNGNGSAEDPED
jgi:hypothetical protein